MICSKCGERNRSDATYCQHCGANFVNRPAGNRWVEVTIAIVMLIVFFPMGLCGLMYSFYTLAELPNPGTDPFMLYMFGFFALGSLLVGAYGVYRAIMLLTKR